MRPTLLFIFFTLVTPIFTYSQFTTVGSAYSNGDCYTLTDDIDEQAGGIWNDQLINLRYDFNVSAEIDMGDISTEEADGIAFVLQSYGTSALGCAYGCIGYINIGQSSLGVMFRTWFNDNIEIWNNEAGDISGMATPLPPISGSVPIIINWDAENTTLSVDFNADGFDIIWVNDIVTNYFEGNPFVYWGFTAATGAGAFTSAHEVCNITASNAAVPTLGQWGMIILFLGSMILALSAIKLKRTQTIIA